MFRGNQQTQNTRPMLISKYIVLLILWMSFSIRSIRFELAEDTLAGPPLVAGVALNKIWRWLEILGNWLIAEVSWAKNSTQNVSRIPTNIYSNLKVKYAKKIHVLRILIKGAFTNYVDKRRWVGNLCFPKKFQSPVISKHLISNCLIFWFNLILSWP